MTQNNHDFDVFHQQQSSFHHAQDEHFLDISCFYQQEEKEDDTFLPGLLRNHTDYFGEAPQVEPFDFFSPPQPADLASEVEEPFLENESDAHDSLEPSTPPPSQITEQRKVPPKSIATKNVCFNICQKTVKVIQTGVYAKKVADLCDYYGAKQEEFIKKIVMQKKQFTGPKALAMYVESDSVFAKVFRDFMRWFLKEKYLRHCMGGDMKDKEAYIRYKNEVILVILD